MGLNIPDNPEGRIELKRSPRRAGLASEIAGLSTLKFRKREVNLYELGDGYRDIPETAADFHKLTKAPLIQIAEYQKPFRRATWNESRKSYFYSDNGERVIFKDKQKYQIQILPQKAPILTSFTKERGAYLIGDGKSEIGVSAADFYRESSWRAINVYKDNVLHGPAFWDESEKAYFFRNPKGEKSNKLFLKHGASYKFEKAPAIQDFTLVGLDDYTIGDGSSDIKPSGTNFHDLTGFEFIEVEKDEEPLGLARWDDTKKAYFLLEENQELFLKNGSKYLLQRTEKPMYLSPPPPEEPQKPKPEPQPEREPQPQPPARTKNPSRYAEVDPQAHEDLENYKLELARAEVTRAQGDKEALQAAARKEVERVRQSEIEALALQKGTEITGLSHIIPPVLPLSESEMPNYPFEYWSKKPAIAEGGQALYYPEIFLNGPGRIRITGGPEEPTGHGEKNQHYSYINVIGKETTIGPPEGQPTGNFNLGLDYIVENPSKEVGAWYGGEVVYAGYDPIYGNRVVVRTNVAYQHNGEIHRVLQAYGHLDKINVKPGDRINQGQPLGIMGNTGASRSEHVDLRTFIIPKGLFEKTLAQSMQPGWTELDLNALEGQLQSSPAMLTNEAEALIISHRKEVAIKEEIVEYNDLHRKNAQKSIKNFIAGFEGVKEQGSQEWTDAIIGEIEAQGLPLTPEIVTLMLTIIERESGFHTTPLVEDMDRMYWDLKTKKSQEHPTIFAMLSSAGLIDAAEKIYLPKLRRVKTEKELEDLVAEVKKGPLMERLKSIPFKGKQYYSQILQEMNEIVQTVGSMQVNTRKAYQMALNEGRTDVTEATVREELYTLRGGLHYGISMAAEAIRIYSKTAGFPSLSESEIQFVLADYNSGLYSCRNAAIQEKLSRLMGIDLVRDGDLLAYHSRGENVGKVLEEASNTEKAFISFAKKYSLNITDAQIREQLLLEKSTAFESTALYKELERIYAEQGKSLDRGKPVSYAMVSIAKTDINRGEIKFGSEQGSQRYSAKRLAGYLTNLKVIQTSYRI